MAPDIFLKFLAPIGTVAGFYLLIRCIMSLARIISPDVRERFPAGTDAKRVTLPRAGRYLISIVVPPFTFITGTTHFSARFAIRQSASGAAIEYQGSRFAVMQVQRTDMSGRKSIPLGRFECPAPGDYEVLCLDPDRIRPGFLLEVSPHIPALTFVPLVLGTILSFIMAGVGLIFTVLWVAGKI
ncbi:hypothetical protein ACQKKX_18325 [Neorhizobium sp. NPDC001467]|uniref:hypothetical protein n=1 Tax=Neorhizobium sp. NPDC001467 TaxID=3390595 RepID=UPI003CFCC50F